MAKLYFRYGTMNSGKTTSLLQVSHNYEEKGMKVLLLKPKVDTKGNEKVVSRLGISRKVDFLVSNEDKIKNIIKNIDYKFNCIIVDEAQFLTKDHIDELFELSIDLDIPVICYGLRTDFLMNGFEGSQRLMLLAHSIEEFKTICRCGKKSLINGRKLNGKFLFEGEQRIIDGEGNIEYEPLCGECYIKERRKSLDSK